MAARRDAWYIRLPSGQELRAKTTKAVVHHVETGVIPKNSFVRRHRADEWISLEWTAEFAEVLADRSKKEPIANGWHSGRPDPKSGIASRLDPLRLRTVGIRGLWEDLLAALDSAMSGGKPLVAAIAGAVIGLILIVLPWVMTNLLLIAGLTDLHGEPLVWPARLFTAGAAIIAMAVAAWTNGLLARMTHSELSEMRPVRIGEAAAGALGMARRLACAYLVIVGGALLLMQGVRWAPEAVIGWATNAGLTGDLHDSLRIGTSIAGLIVEVMLWCAIVLAGLLAPILAIEEIPFVKGIAAWVLLVREHLGRLLLAEALAVGLGGLAALPFALPVWLAIDHYPGLPPAARYLAYGIALTPLTAFLAVANVFIYLDARYEQNQ